jgi:hypothetical protein
MAGRVDDSCFPPGAFGHFQQSLANRIRRRPAAHLLRGVFVTSTALVPQPAPVVTTGASVLPVRRGNTTPADTSSLETDLRRGDFGKIRRNKFTLENVRHLDTGVVKLVDEEVTRLLTDMEKAGYARINRRDLQNAVDLVAIDDPFDSMQDWLEELPVWDKIPRIANFLPVYFGTQSTPYTYAVSRYLWTAMAARILDPGCKVDMVPVLVGEQGVGKTTALSIIAPTLAHRDDVTLSDRTSKLPYIAVGKIVLVWEELQGIRGKVDADQVKTFITTPHVDVPGSKKGTVERYLRRFVIFGTTDKFEFLRDPAGDRRYLPFEVKKIDHDKLQADQVQLWAEALAIVRDRKKAGFQLVDYAEAVRLAPAEHRKFAKRAPWADSQRLISWIQSRNTFWTTDEALEAVGVPASEFTKNKRQMTGSLRQLECEERSTRVPDMKNPQFRWHRV